MDVKSTLTKLPNDIILDIFVYSDFKDKALGLVQVNKEYNKMINNDINHFNEWISKLFDYNARYLYITGWMRQQRNIKINENIVPIEPLIQIIDGKPWCVCIEDATFENMINDSFLEYKQIFDKLSNTHHGWSVDESKQQLKWPSLKHLIFQKEIVETYFRINGLNLSDPNNKRIPTGLFEFAEAIPLNNGVILVLNQQKRGIALVRFIGYSKDVRNKMKKIDALKDKDMRLWAYDYAMNVGLQTYHLDLDLV